METPELYDIFIQNPQITTDTRKCIKNSIFFALKGNNFNGNKFASLAIDNGCKIAIVDEEEYANPSKKIYYVENSLLALQKLARFHRDKFKMPVVAITGTNGKTTSKELITAVLSKEFNVLSTQGNLNNHIGVPLTLLRMNKQHEIAIIEMGASHVGEIKTLCEIANPDYGLITNLGKAHIEGFGSFENIIKTKGELYDHLRHVDRGTIFIDQDNSHLIDMAKGLTSICYGVEDNLFVSGSVVSSDPFLKCTWRFTKNEHVVQTRLIGTYNLTNVLAAVTIGKYFGVKTAKICEAIQDYTPSNLRSQLKKTEKNVLLIDAYNANPTSMIAALDNFSKMSLPEKVLILGDMRELGEDSLLEHQKIVDLVNNNAFDQIYLIGENFKQTKNSNQSFSDSSEFINYLTTHPIQNKSILIKGSRGIQLEKCIDFL